MFVIRVGCLLSRRRALLLNREEEEGAANGLLTNADADDEGDDGDDDITMQNATRRIEGLLAAEDVAFIFFTRDEVSRGGWSWCCCVVCGDV